MKNKLNPSLLAIIAEGLLSRLSFGLIGFTLPLYARHLGLSLSQVGMLVAVNSAVAILLKPSIGWAADRFGLKKTFLAAISLRSIVSLLFGFAAAPWELFAIRSVHGLSMSMRDPAANTLIAEHGGKKSAASAFAWYQTARTVANSVSRAVAGIILTITAANYPLVFFIAFALSVLPVIVVVLFVQEEANVSSATPSAEGPSEIQPQSKPRPSVAPYVGFGFLIAGTAEMLNGLFPILATEYAGLSKTQAGLVYAISTLAAIAAGPVFGWLSDHVSRKLVLALRSVANTVSSVLYWVAPTFLGIGLAKTTDDIGKAAFRPAWGALMAETAAHDKATRARTISWLSMGEDAGGVAAPVLAGFLWSTWGIGALMSVRILLAIVTETYAWAIARPPRGDEAVNETTLLRTEAAGKASA